MKLPDLVGESLEAFSSSLGSDLSGVWCRLKARNSLMSNVMDFLERPAGAETLWFLRASFVNVWVLDSVCYATHLLPWKKDPYGFLPPDPPVSFQRLER